MSNYAALVAPDERIAKVRVNVGRTIQEILRKESRFDIYELLGSIEVLVGSKIHHDLPTSQSERMVFALTWLAREVGTGGFRQFLINSAGDFWKDVVFGLEGLGDRKGLSLFRKVISVFPNGIPSEDRLARLDQLSRLEERDAQKLSDHFTETTKQYFREPFPNWEAVFRYVKEHPQEFDLGNA